MTNLSPNFSLLELTHSNTAKRQGIDNTPSPAVLVRLRNTARMMEIVRTILAAPILVSSGYRSPALNVAIGGSKTSDHVTGNAIDFVCPRFGSPYKIALELSRHKEALDYDQLIHEYGDWVHISFGPRRRRQDLTIRNAREGYLRGIHPD